MHPHSRFPLTLHYLARALVLGGFAFFIIQLSRTGDLNLYIESRMQPLVKLSALALYVVAAQQWYAAICSWFDNRDNRPTCECAHELPVTWSHSLLLYGWFSLPLLIGFALPNALL